MFDRNEIAKFVSELRKYPTLKELKRSDFFRLNRAKLREILTTVDLSLADGVRPRLRSFLRAVSWNIEKGKAFSEIARAFNDHPVLKHADLILLQEVDCGMARSGNRHVARDLAASIGAHYVFAPAHLELTKGVGEDLSAPGENTASLQGNAILSRYELASPRIIELPQCSDHFELPEKRYGRRIALAVDVKLRGPTITAICVHLEVRRTPSCRARQMAAIMGEIRRLRIENPVLIGGDLNTNTFPRGNFLYAVGGLLRIMSTPLEKLKGQLTRPDLNGEPLFELLSAYGFSFGEFNDHAATSSASLLDLEDARRAPSFLRRRLLKRLRPLNCRLDFRLDWFAARNLRSLGEGQTYDAAAGVSSVSPRTLTDLKSEISDHRPIVVDINLDQDA